MESKLEFPLPPDKAMICRAIIARALRRLAVSLVLSSFAVAAAQTPADDPKTLEAAANSEIAAATALFQKGEAAAAIAKFDTAISLAARSGNTGIQANAYLYRAISRLTVSQTLDAVNDFEKALELYTAANDPTGQYLSLSLLAATYFNLKNDEKARPFMERSWELIKEGAYEKLNKEILKTIGGPSFQILGEKFVRFGDRKRGLDFLWRAYELTAGGPESERIDALLRYGGAQITLDTPKFALSFYETALKRARNAKLRVKEAEVLTALGGLHVHHLTDATAGRNYLFEALPIAEELKNDAILFRVLVALGDAGVVTVDLAKASDYFRRANHMALRAGVPAADRALVLYRLSDVQTALGETKESAENEDAALALAKNGVHVELEARILAARAMRAIEEGFADPTLTGERSKERARQIMEQLQTAINLVKDRPGTRRLALQWLTEIGKFMARTGGFPQALELLTKSREVARAYGYRSDEAMLLNEIAMTKYISGNYREAITDLNETLVMFRSIGMKGREARAMEYLMMAWTKQNNRSLAIFFGKNAINIYQGFRQNASSLTPEQQKAFLTRFESAYRSLARLLIEEGRLAEAEQVLTMLKQEELIEYVRRDDSVVKQLLETMTVSEYESAAMLRYAELAETITSIGKEFSELESERKQFDVGAFPKQKRYDELKQKLADSTLVFEKFLDDLKLRFGQGDSRVAQVDSSLKKTLERLKADRTAIVSTIVGVDTLNIIVTTSRTQRAHSIKKPAAEINELVAKLRGALTSPQYDPRPASQQLYDLLVKPIEGDLAGIKADTIVWSLDGTLRYMPPAVLWDKRKGYLAERYSNVIINLASRDAIGLPRTSGELSVLGVGVSKPNLGFSALDAVPDELDCIVSDKAAGLLSSKPQCKSGVLNGRKLLDERFTLASFEGELGRYPIVHIASHFKLTPGDDKNSFLLLGGGDDRRFTVDKLRNESLADVELIVLSACNTATPGGAKANGIEIEGFGSIAQREGAKAVMATLWPVADNSTKDFMVEFYQLYGKQGRSKADAVRLAQMKLLNGSYNASAAEKHRADEFVANAATDLPKFTTDPKAPYAHPYFWSPFILIGNWR